MIVLEFWLIVVLAFGLSMDAFAVSMTNGMCYYLPARKNALYSGLAFGLAQGSMPLIGYYAGHWFSALIGSIDHWLALVVLSIIGGKMIYDAIKTRKDKSEGGLREFSFKMLFLQAIATSIDALAVGISLGVMQVNVFYAVTLIAVITFVCCFAGVYLGRACGVLFRGKAQTAGGVILVLIGIRIFMEHMEWLFH